MGASGQARFTWLNCKVIVGQRPIINKNSNTECIDSLKTSMKHLFLIFQRHSRKPCKFLGAYYQIKVRQVLTSQGTGGKFEQNAWQRRFFPLLKDRVGSWCKVQFWFSNILGVMWLEKAKDRIQIRKWQERMPLEVRDRELEGLRDTLVEALE